jgi:hypothetical protein
MLIFGPTTHSVLMSDLTLIQTLRIRLIKVPYANVNRWLSKIFRKIWVHAIVTPDLSSSELGLEFLYGQITSLVHGIIDITFNLVSNLVLLVDFGFS